MAFSDETVAAIRRAFFILLVTFGAALPALAETIPLADFFRHPQLSGLRLSPSGQHIAALIPAGEKKRRQLAILNLGDLSKSHVIAGFDDADIESVRWLNEERLVFSVSDEQAAYGHQFGEGLYAVDREGKQGPRRLIKRRQSIVASSAIVDRELSVDHRFHSTVDDGSNDVIVEHYAGDSSNELTNVSLLRLDTTTGTARSLTGGAPANARVWALDTAGNPRAVVTLQKGVERVFVKRAVDAPWELLREYDAIDPKGKLLWPIVVDKLQHLYFIGVAGPGADTTSLMQLDLANASAQPQELITLKGYDFGGDFTLSAGRLAGVSFVTDATGSHWFDSSLRAIQTRVDAALPATTNLIDCGDCQSPSRVLVKSFSDRQPSVYQMFDVQSGQLSSLGAAYPWIDPKRMATREFQQIKARDGLNLPVYVTRPGGVKTAAPMVVLVHGGPWVRGGEWRWYAESQFLASRGYVVIEPEYRGGLGFGWRHFHAGWKQWGLAMQDDIADAARWAVAQGLADSNRICIAGASYGGYAVLMGLIRDPALYRCGVEWVGVTDIGLMYSITWSDLDSVSKAYSLPSLVGDPVADAAQLAATSPVKLADRVTQPLLMAYGGQDRRVPIDHGIQFRDAVRRKNPNVEWIDYPLEGHGWMLEANQVDFWTRVESFLDRRLKSAP